MAPVDASTTQARRDCSTTPYYPIVGQTGPKRPPAEHLQSSQRRPICLPQAYSASRDRRSKLAVRGALAAVFAENGSDVRGDMKAEGFNRLPEISLAPASVRHNVLRRCES